MGELMTYTTTEAAAILKISRRTLYNYIKANQIKAVKVGGDWRITTEALKTFLEAGTQKNYLAGL